MKLNTAICLQLAGVALLCEARARPRGVALWVARIAATIVVAVGLVVLVESVVGRDLIDTLLVDDPYESLGAPGRMSPLAAVAFVCVGTALLALDAPRYAWMT